MTPDDVREEESSSEVQTGRFRMDEKFKIVVAILAVLVVGEIFSLARLHSLRNDFRSQEAQTRQQLTDWTNQELSARLSAFEKANAEEFQAFKIELDAATKHLGAQGGELRRARHMVSKLEDEHNAQVSELKHEIALKADQQQLGALTDDVSATKSDLGKTKQNVDTLAENLGMTRSRFGTLIARNHDQIAALRKLGERDYFEFSALRHQPLRVGGVGVDLKKTNVKHHRFNVDLLVDDIWVEKKGRTINEPVFFTVRGSRTFCELVVNRVDRGKISGYISTPKGATRMATRMEGVR